MSLAILLALFGLVSDPTSAARVASPCEARFPVAYCSAIRGGPDRTERWQSLGTATSKRLVDSVRGYGIWFGPRFGDLDDPSQTLLAVVIRHERGGEWTANGRMVSFGDLATVFAQAPEADPEVSAKLVRITEVEARSADCPALIDAIETFPKTFKSVVPLASPRMTIFDGEEMIVGAYGASGDNPALIEITGNYGVPTTDWAVALRQKLKACWRPPTRP